MRTRLSILMGIVCWCCPVMSLHAALTIWANNGEDKVTREELRATLSKGAVYNSTWDGTTVSLFGARNEVVAFNLLIESPAVTSNNVQVQFSKLNGPGGATITSKAAAGNGLFDWTGRNIELFYVRYLQIKGLSRMGYDNYYDERHVPERLRRPHVGPTANANSGWVDRPDHDRYYPDIAVPLEAQGPFTIAADTSQSIWCDIYIPKTAPTGLYTGTITISSDGVPPRQVPVALQVRNFSLPDEPNSLTMLYMGESEVNERYLNEAWPFLGSPQRTQSLAIIDRHAQLAHRHKISLIGADSETIDRMDDAWTDRLSGALFTPARGYDGPGVGVGNNVYSIGTYGSWSPPIDSTSETSMREGADAWVNWFTGKSFSTPTEYFLYLIDESSDYATQEKWSRWINNNPGPGQRLMSLATISIPTAQDKVPSLDIPCSPAKFGISDVWQKAAEQTLAAESKRLYAYNGMRPVTGIFMTEEDGVGLRMISWGQYKKGIQRWFYWESTYYVNYQAYGSSNPSARGNLFQQARTFGTYEGTDPVMGETGSQYANGDGVLFYPGTDLLYPADSYGLAGPIASLRLKYWRRGIQDVDYLTLAKAVNPTRTAEIVANMVPKFYWEFGVADVSDPTYLYSDISWSTNPDVWEGARAELADIIDKGKSSSLFLTGTVTYNGSPLAGVVMNGLPGNPVTTASGAYTALVKSGWSGTVTPTLSGYSFTPANRTSATVTADRSGQNYAATDLTYTISGKVTVNDSGRGGVVMSGLPGNPVTTASGTYTAVLSSRWSGTVTPLINGYSFNDVNRSSTNLPSGVVDWNYLFIASVQLVSPATELFPTISDLLTTPRYDDIAFFVTRGNLSETLLFDRQRNITMLGGYDGSFNSGTGMSVIKGQLIVSKGSLTVSNISIH
jgi:Domain of unknown function (DUF4091)/Family of unknown function (DUF6067)